LDSTTFVGYSGVGNFKQVAGELGILDNVVGIAQNMVFLGYNSSGTGTYEISGSGQLLAKSLRIGGSGTGIFTQSGGTVTITPYGVSDDNPYFLYLGSYAGSRGIYNLSGGQLSALYEYVGYDAAATGLFQQTGGSNSTAYVAIGSGGRFVLSGGTLSITTNGYGGISNQGAVDCSNSQASLLIGSYKIVDLAQANLMNVGGMTVTLGAHSVLTVPAGFNPYEAFGRFTCDVSSMVHTAGSSLTVAAGQVIGGQGSINDPVVCSGTITCGGYGALNLNNGLTLSSGGSITLGGGDITVNDTTSKMTGGVLAPVRNLYIGRGREGMFDQSGGYYGTNQYGHLYLGYSAGDSGIYILDGNGTISISNGEYVGYSGSGTFTQSAGTNGTQPVGLIIGYNSGSEGIYELSGAGLLQVQGEWIGGTGTGTFIQSGGTHSVGVGDYLVLGNGAGGSGTYNLSATGQLSVGGSLTVGGAGTGTFTQWGGTSTVASLRLAASTGSSGTYNLNGGVLTPSILSGGSGTAAFNFGGGTLKPKATFATTLPMTLTGVGGNANVDTAGNTVMLSGQLSGVGGLNKLGPNTLTLSGVNTYAGNTTVSAGTLTLASAGSLVLTVREAINSSVAVTSGAKLDLFGTIKLDIDDITASAEGWTLVSNSGITVYESSFVLTTTDGASFTQANDVWSYAEGPRQWTFTEATGVLSLTTVPEASPLLLLGVGVTSLLGYTWRSRKHATRDTTQQCCDRRQSE
jgi:autotransporter-associated beta strand protein